LFTSWFPGVRRGHNRETHIYMFILKKIFFRTSRLISIKLSNINRPWVKGILNCSSEGPGPFQRGDNYKNAKMGWGH
jgi:hypothetical protein